MSSVVLVVAIADNGVIGDRGKIPWRIADDMKHFKAITMGKPCIMGRKTWNSLPKKPLPGRTNIVLTRDSAFSAADAAIVYTMEEALAFAASEQPREIAILGGADIYKMALPHASRIYLTEVHRDVYGDTHFTFDRTGWHETSREDRATPEGLAYSFVTLER